MSSDMEGFEKQFAPTGEQVFNDILSRNPNLWDLYAKQDQGKHLGAGLSGGYVTKTLTGKTKAGATIKVIDRNNEVYYEAPTPGLHADTVPEGKKLVQYAKGISIEVNSPHEPGESYESVELYVPDDPAAYPAIESPHAVTFSKDGIRQKIVPAEDAVPEDNGKFDGGVAQIKQNLGDNIIWDSPEAEAIYYSDPQAGPLDL